MKNKNVILAVVAVFIALVSIGVYATINKEEPANDTKTAQNSQESTGSQEEESATYRQYAAMTGETYDRNFIANMIAHHQGAVDMAKLAQTNAKHTKLKTMADDIIAAQEKEIADMLAWQKAWGYPPTSAEDMQDHSAMGMMDDMVTMTSELEGKTDDEFDKAFIDLMIEHHQGAIDMARPGLKNAYHQEVKDLAEAVVNDQSAEIEQMKTWQTEWGYRQ